MPPEQIPKPVSSEETGVGSSEGTFHAEIDLYEVAEFIFMARVEQLQAIGELRRASEITDEDELDDHFDDLSRLYRQVCGELGLAWPPPPFAE